VTLEIGAGSTTDDFSAIDWGNGPFFIKTEIDPDGGVNYTIEGTSQLLSVPYALFAKSAASTEEIDPFFNNAVASDITAEDTTRWGTKELPVAQAGNIVTFDGNNWLAKDLVVTTSTTGSSTVINNMQPYLALNYCIALQGLYPSRNSSDPFVGEIQLFGFNFTPRGFAPCSGQLLAISQNQALFSLLGTIYGGDGRTTFGLPDLRGRTPISYGQGPGLSNRNIGEKSGTETFILNVNQMPAHSHIVNISYED
jgi:microcystin-dependent protein